MVQNKEVEEKALTNGEIKEDEVDKQCENGKVDEEIETNGHIISEDEESDDDDYLDHLLMLPSLDAKTSDRNRQSFVSSLLSAFCSAIESRKEYQKIKQELIDNCAPIEEKQEDVELKTDDVALETNLNGKEESPQPETIEAIEVNLVDEAEEVVETRRQSIRLNKAKFVPEHEPSINDQFFVCRRCTIFFRTRKLRKEHNILHHRRKLPLAQVVVDEKQKQRQRRSSSNKDPFICDLCQKLFKQKALLRSHMNTHLTEPQFFCNICPYASKRNNDLKKHLDMHHNPDRIVKQRMRKRKCDECEEVLNGKKAFKLHMKETHPRESPVKKCRVIKRVCEKCDEVLEGVKAHRLHMKQKHSEVSHVIRCETCHRKFKTNFRLKKHQLKFAESGHDCKTYFRQNGVETTFDCQHCEKKFVLKSHLSLHLKKHANLTCEKCNVTFKNKFNLKWHEFSHLEIEPKCSNCAVSFTSEQKFSVHLKKKICVGNGAVD